MSDLYRWLTAHLLQGVFRGSHPTQAGLEALARIPGSQLSMGAMAPPGLGAPEGGADSGFSLPPSKLRSTSVDGCRDGANYDE